MIEVGEMRQVGFLIEDLNVILKISFIDLKSV
jgi:hypothetical protein